MKPTSLTLLVSVAATVLVSCIVDVDWSGARLACTDGRCPDGFECVEERCVPEGGEPPVADAAVDPPDPDAEPEPVADAAPPDAAATNACDEQYGGAVGYQLCEATDGSCQFFVNNRLQVTCEQICRELGGTCLTAHDGDPVDPCALQAEDGCLTPHGSQICTCSLGVSD